MVVKDKYQTFKSAFRYYENEVNLRQNNKPPFL